MSKFKESRTCECGYTSQWTSNWSAHKKRCKLRLANEMAQQMVVEKQLASKGIGQEDDHATKDQRILELLEANK